MNQTRTQIQGCNDLLVDELFDLLYQRNWLASKDTHSGEAYAEFRKRMLLLAKELRREELSTAGEQRCRQIGELVCRLMEELSVLESERIVSLAQVIGMRNLLCRIAEAVSAVSQ